MLGHLSRSDAVAHARYVYVTVANRAIQAAGEDRDYVAALAIDWLRRLNEVSVASGHLQDRERRTLDRLTTAVSHPDLSRNALIDWVDALPLAVVELLEQNAVLREATDISSLFDSVFNAVGDPEADPVTAGNGQPTLALAA